MESVVPSREFFSILYPAIVESDDRALETLGGIGEVTKTFNSATQRLRLVFRPDMYFAKPVYGDPKEGKSLIIRARRLRNRLTGEVTVVSEILATVPRTYEFNSLMDFQFGPFEKMDLPNKSTTDQSDQFRVFYNDLVIHKPTKSLSSHLNNGAPLFAPPPLFTRLDQPICYSFSSRFRSNEYVELDSHDHNHPYHRRERKSNACISSMAESTPQSPLPAATEALQNLGSYSRRFAHDLELYFNSRPIWSRAAITYSLQRGRVTDNAFKVGLQAFAYYIPSGPWSRVWIRFGYDPRSDPASRIYQSVEFRIRSHELLSRLNIGGRERPADLTDTDLSSSDSDDKAQKYSALVVQQPGRRKLGSSGPSKQYASLFRFNKDCLPESHNTTYQLTDIDLPEVVELLASPVTRPHFDPVDGWLPSGYQKTVREIMFKYLELWTKD